MKSVANKILLISLISITHTVQWSFTKANIDTKHKVTVTKETSKKNNKENKKTTTVSSNKGTEVNKIAIVVYTDSEPIIITFLDIDRKSLDGQKRSAKDVLLERLKFYEATEYYKISGYQEDAEKHLKAIKNEHNLNDSQLASIFKESGYTLEEGRKELEMTYAVRRLMQELVINRIVVSEKEIKDYYEKNPVHVCASYKVRKGKVKKSVLTQEQVEDLSKTGKHKEEIVWMSPYWIFEDELAEHKKFITTMKVNAIALSEALDDEYEFVQVIKTKPGHLKTLKERHNEITQILRYPKYDHYMKEYNDQLLEKYEVVYY